MNGDAGVIASHPRLHNHVDRNPDGSLSIREFSVEVDESVAEAVKEIIRSAGFEIGGEALVDRREVQKAVYALVDLHRRDPEAPPRIAVWFRLDDPYDVHLLEIADGLFDPGDGALEGVSMGAGSAMPGVRYVVIYLASPSEVHKAFEINGGHPAIQAMRTRSCRIVHPADDWQALTAEFCELAAQTVL